MKSILIMEGDRSAARLFAEVFKQDDWQVDSPSDGQSMAEALLGNKHYDIILVSYRIPVMSGIDLIRLARNLEHRKHTPVLMATGSYDVIDEALSAGANEILHKPIDVDRLLAAATRHLSKIQTLAEFG